MPLNLPNGIGATLGDRLVVNKPLAMSGTPYFISSVIGDDGNSGLSRLDPMATIGAAYAVAVVGDWIVVAADHDETLTSALTLANSLTIVGEGQADGKPTATFRNNSAAGSLFNLQDPNIQLINLNFPAQTQACSAPLIICDQPRFLMRGCYLEADGNSNAAVLQLNTGAAQCQVDSTTFISTSVAESTPSSNDPPSIALEVTAAMDDLRMTGTVFDGGQIGWSDNALKASAAAVTRIRADQMSFLNGADYALESTSTGYINVGTSTGDVVGSW